MRHETCCVVNCKNNGRNSVHKFYKFPQASWKREQRIKWIIAVKRKNADGSPWSPKPHDRICSAHFIGGAKADEQDSPSYIPRIFPTTYTSTAVNANLAISRYKRCMERNNKKEKNTANLPNIHYESSVIEMMENIHSTKIDEECQVQIFSRVENEGKTFICNRYVYSGKDICDSEVQTEISSNSKIIKFDKKTKHQGCNTIKKIFAHQATLTENKYFSGFRSITEDEELIDLAGVTLQNFRFLLKRIDELHELQSYDFQI